MLELHSHYEEGIGTLLYAGKPGSKWSHKTHKGRFAATAIPGRFASYDASGALIGYASSARNAKILVRSSLPKDE